MITKGSNYTCDRCGVSTFMPEQDAKKNEWRNVARYTADGVHTARLMCPKCGTSYDKLAEKQDNQFNDFMNGGGK